MVLGQQLYRSSIVRSAFSVAVLVAGAIGLYFAYQWLTIPVVTLTEVVEGPVVQAFYATGTLSPDREYPVKANVEGTLVEVFADKGSPVKKGDIVAKIYVEEFLLKRKQAQADLDFKKEIADTKTSPSLLEFDTRIRAANQQYDIAKREYDRLSQLRETAGRTLTEIERAQDAMQTYKSTAEALAAQKALKLLEYERDVKTTQAQVDIAQWNIDQQTLTSPIDGVVLGWPTARGTRVKVNDLIMNIADVGFDKLVMRTNVDEEDKTRVRLDQIVQTTLYSYPNRVFQGHVRKVYPQADPARRTFEVDVQIDEPDAAFSAGMTGELAFVVARKDVAVVVPSQALQHGEVWTVRDGRLAKVDVEVGLRSIQRTEILRGLAKGDQVVVSPLVVPREGQAVRTKILDPKTAAGLNEPEKANPSLQKIVH